MSQITLSAVQVAFEARLSTFSAGGTVVVESAPVYLPQAGAGYLSGRLSGYARTPLGVGPDAPAEVNGTYTVSVQRSATEGVGMAALIASRIVHLFNRGTALALATGQVLSIDQASEQPAIFAGDWITVPVVVKYFGTE